MSPEPLDEWIQDAVAWLAAHCEGSAGFQQVLRTGGWRGARRLSAWQSPAGIEALSLITAEGRWFLAGTREAPVLSLLELAGAAPAERLEASERVAAWVRPLLARSGRLGLLGEAP
jgi:hypothetical protein